MLRYRDFLEVVGTAARRWASFMLLNRSGGTSGVFSKNPAWYVKVFGGDDFPKVFKHRVARVEGADLSEASSERIYDEGVDWTSAKVVPRGASSPIGGVPMRNS